MIRINRVNMTELGPVDLSREIEEAKIETFVTIDCPVDMTTVVNKTYHAIADALGAKGPRVERIIANGPATIVFWGDGEKTVVKCRECNVCDRKSDAPGPCCYRRYDSEKAVMAAMLKRLAPGWQDDVRKAEKEVQ